MVNPFPYGRAHAHPQRAPGPLPIQGIYLKVEGVWGPYRRWHQAVITGQLQRTGGF